MHTYQDLEALDGDERKRIDFVHRLIIEHEGSEMYLNAEIADEYIRGRNREAKSHVNYLTTSTGKQIVDVWTPNTKTARSFFRILLMGDVQYLLGNGVKWNNKEKAENVLGKDFDIKLSDLLTFAKAHGCSFGFFNLDHLEVFPVRSINGGFAPLYDSETGLLRAGVKFWYYNEGKTLKANLYEESGITPIVWDKTNQEKAEGVIVSDDTTILDGGKKKPYRINNNKGVGYAPVEPGENYPGFPIIPLYGNSFRESELFMGLKDLIDEYDRLANSTANDLDTAMIYWIFQNAGGMDNADMAKALDQLRALRAVNAEEGDIKPVTLNPPISERHAEMVRVERAIYDDYMGLNFKDIVSGAATATQIKAAYEPVKNKANDTEKCLLDFLYKLMRIAGIEDEDPSFEPDPIKNVSEETNAIIAEAQYLPRDYTVQELLYLRGDGDKVADILDQLDQEEMGRMSGIGLVSAQRQNGANDEISADNKSNNDELRNGL